MPVVLIGTETVRSTSISLDSNLTMAGGGGGVHAVDYAVSTSGFFPLIGSGADSSLVAC